MPNPLPQLASSDLVSDEPEAVNALLAARHSLGRTDLTDADDGYVVVDDDELLVCTLGADMALALPEASTCTGRSVHIFLATAGGHTLTVSATASNINGAGTLALSSAWTGRRFVARATDWIAF
jgi:hypothetical protein